MSLSGGRGRRFEENTKANTRAPPPRLASEGRGGGLGEEQQPAHIQRAASTHTFKVQPATLLPGAHTHTHTPKTSQSDKPTFSRLLYVCLMGDSSPGRNQKVLPAEVLLANLVWAFSLSLISVLL